MKRNQSGFTLIEIAIVLVIIGLLLGGVLKGQELINSAKVKNLSTDFRNIPVYIYGYQDKFRAIPGDDANAGLHVGAGAGQAASATAGNGVLDGNWNSTTITDETYLFWQHVRMANLATGATSLADPSYIPTNNAGGKIGIQSGTTVAGNTPIATSAGVPIAGSYIICSTGILGKFVKQLDLQMDDGNTDGGSMLAGVQTAVGTPMVALPTASIVDSSSYTVCMGV